MHASVSLPWMTCAFLGPPQVAGLGLVRLLFLRSRGILFWTPSRVVRPLQFVWPDSEDGESISIALARLGVL